MKTENILIGSDGYIKLADFGFAKRVPNRTWYAATLCHYFTQSNLAWPCRTVCGTSEYMAPEIIREGKRHRAGLGLGDGYGKECDIWAYGILIFELANVRVCLSLCMYL